MTGALAAARKQGAFGTIMAGGDAPTRSTLLDSVHVGDAVCIPTELLDPSGIVAAAERRDAVWRI